MINLISLEKYNWKKNQIWFHGTLYIYVTLCIYDVAFNKNE